METLLLYELSLVSKNVYYSLFRFDLGAFIQVLPRLSCRAQEAANRTAQVLLRLHGLSCRHLPQQKW